MMRHSRSSARRPPHMSWRDDVAPSEELTDADEIFKTVIDQLMKQAGSQPKGRDFVFSHARTQFGERQDSRRGDGQFGPVEKWPPDFERRSVEGQ